MRNKLFVTVFAMLFCVSTQAQLTSTNSAYFFKDLSISTASKTNRDSTIMLLNISKGKQLILSDSVPINLKKCSGFAFPNKQPLKDYFIFSKHSKHQGKTYILYEDGTLKVIAGGTFWVGVKHPLLFILAERDYDNLIIYNLKKQKIEVNKFNCDEFSDWYYYKGKYFGKVGTECGEEQEKEMEVSEFMRPVVTEEYTVSFGTLTEAHKTERDIEKALKLKKYADCK